MTAASNATVEHLDRFPLDRDELAAVVAERIPAGSVVNLGIGQPTRVSDFLDPSAGIVLHTENGMLGMGPRAHGDDIDDDLINAGKIPVSELPGSSYFDHATSFAMIRGGHIDVCVIGAFQVSVVGDLANWHTGESDAIPAVGGAMDLATGARDVYVMMTMFDKRGKPKLVERCTYPITGLACVSRLFTDVAVVRLGGAARPIVEATYGITVAELRERLGIAFDVEGRTDG